MCLDLLLTFVDHMAARAEYVGISCAILYFGILNATRYITGSDRKSVV